MEHENALIDILKLADLPIAGVLMFVLFNLWREYRDLRHTFTDYMMERAANGDPAAAAVADRIWRRENGQGQTR